MVGCGGSGTKVVRHIREAVHKRLLEVEWELGIPECWRFLGIDTPITQEAASEIPPLPADDYISISSKHRTYPDLYRSLEAQQDAGGKIRASDLSGWIPDPERARVPLAKGAGSSRAIGRAAALNTFHSSVDDMLRNAFQTIRGAQHSLDAVARHLGCAVAADSERGLQEPLVLVCSSIGGGTGAGVALDVVTLLRAIDPAGAHPVLALLSNDIFEMDNKSGLAANSLAFISEMLAAYWSREGQFNDLPLVPRTVNTRGTGPHSIFLIGREQQGGSSFQSTSEVYLAVGDALSTWVTSDVVQEEITNFLVANWQAASSQKATSLGGGYPFAEDSQDGVLSSFGVSKVSVGRDRFNRWAEHKLARTAMGMLLNGHLRLSVTRDPKLTDEDWVEQLGSERAQAVFSAEVRANDSGGGLAAVEDFFASKKDLADRRAEALGQLKEGVGSQAMPASAMRDQVKNKATKIKDDFARLFDAQEATEWRKKLVFDTCRAVSEIAAWSSLPVAVSAIEGAMSIAQKHVNNLAEKARRYMHEYNDNVDGGLQQIGYASGNLAPGNASLDDALDKMSVGLAYNWGANQLNIAADLVKHAQKEVLEEIFRLLNSTGKALLEELDTEPVSEWPEPSESGISVKYHPSAIELPLESHDQWMEQLAELCNEANEPGVQCGNLPIDPVRYLMVAGHPNGLLDEIPSLLRPKSGSSWSPGQYATLECDASAERWLESFRMWANRAGSSYRRYVGEGLAAYLSQVDPHTQQNRVDYTERLRRFRQNLYMAKQKSSPMMCLADNHPPRINFIKQAFPFKDGDPAAGVVNDVIGEMGKQWSPALKDMPSVMLTSYFEVPVHPLTVRSLTEPIADEVLNSGDTLSSVFWQWRRSRPLDAFVPLPREPLENIIRGFAIARLCGLMTAEVDRACKIVSPDGRSTAEFPWPLLTQPPIPADILAALLESLALCYGAANSEEQERRLHSYKILHNIGSTHITNPVSDVLRKNLEAGHHNSFQPLCDPKIAGTNKDDRIASAEQYLKEQIDRFKRCGDQISSKLIPRDRTGSPEKGVLTGELAVLYIPVYEQLIESLKSDYIEADEV